jgi:tRNA (adenine37-N6)-methyltransferase
MEFEPIGIVHSDRSEVRDDDWDIVRSTIVLDPSRFGPGSLRGLDEFSHVEVVYVFDRVDEAEIETEARHPRGNPAWPEVGIFAQRARMRPNRIGVTVCGLLGVDGLTLSVHGLDALDGTPVLDLKPYMAEFGPRGEIRQPAWSHELMAAYWSRADMAGPAGCP